MSLLRSCSRFWRSSYKDLAPTEPFNLLRALSPRPKAFDLGLFCLTASRLVMQRDLRRSLLQGSGLCKRTVEGGIGHTVFASFQMAGEPCLKRRVGFGFNGNVVPTVEFL